MTYIYDASFKGNWRRSGATGSERVPMKYLPVPFVDGSCGTVTLGKALESLRLNPKEESIEERCARFEAELIAERQRTENLKTDKASLKEKVKNLEVNILALELENEKDIKRGDAIKQLQQSFGIKSVANVYNLLSLNKLPEQIKTLIHNGDISSNAVLAITREIKSPEEQIAAVEEAVFEAQLEAEKEGKAPKKATAAHVKTIKPKSIKDRLAAVKEALEKSGANNVRAKAFLELMEGLEGKASTKKLAAIFE
jgi:hypothetical protein